MAIRLIYQSISKASEDNKTVKSSDLVSLFHLYSLVQRECPAKTIMIEYITVYITAVCKGFGVLWNLQESRYLVQGQAVVAIQRNHYVNGRE